MNSFVYRDGYLFAEEVSLATIAERFGTPCYVYSRSMIVLDSASSPGANSSASYVPVVMHPRLCSRV
jgi:hypothetical protein